MSKVFEDFVGITEVRNPIRDLFLFPEVWEGYSKKWGTRKPIQGMIYTVAFDKGNRVRHASEMKVQKHADGVMTLLMDDPTVAIIVSEQLGGLAAIRWDRAHDSGWSSKVRRRKKLVEVRLIPSKKDFRKWDAQIKKEKPLKDTDSILVYHGFNDPEDALLALRKGLSGKSRARRIYSYESNNNPKGLFVTSRFDKAKEFAHGHRHSVIIEFHAKVKDLEAPVWPGGGYTVQGELSQNFKDADDRTAAQLAVRKDFKVDPDSPEAVYGADRPEVAGRLFTDFEQQALFTGNLNPNGIRAVWVRRRDKKSGYMLTTTPFVRMKPREFLKEFKDYKFSKSGEEKERDQEKAFRPRDRFDPKVLVNYYLNEWGGGHKSRDTIEMQLKWLFSTLKVMNRDTYHMDMFLWPAQVSGFKRWSRKIKDPEDMKRYLPRGGKR